ncbi:MAG: TIGR00282 family metallophosphoesterase [Planctomycetota bacterium]
MELNVLIIGDIVGRPGRMAVKMILPDLIRKEGINFCIANAENSAGGSGLTAQIVSELLSYGVNVITSGDHIWKKKEIIDYIETVPNLLRPANYPPESAGRGYNIFPFPDNPDIKIAVINLQGRVFMPSSSDCPFHTVDKILTEILPQTKIVIVDIHAEATSEKVALGWYLNGRISCIFGTHTHIQTADEGILPQGTAYITDVGMCGPYDSVIGRRTDRVLSAFITGMPASFDVAKNDVRLCGAVVTIDSDTGKAIRIKRINELLPPIGDTAEEEE